VGEPRSTYSGPGRVLVAVYAVFALAATARAGVQIATKFDQAPLAYMLSAVAAIVYIVATVALARSGPVARRVAFVACSVELAGVLVIGTLSLAWPDAFPDETVWSGYGRGYGFVPLVLPVLGLLWLRRSAGDGYRVG
jgi:cytochrome bd-type quinol oxidase subunit 2